MVTRDALWKGVIEDLFDNVMEFFYPSHLDTLDLSQIEFLEKTISNFLDSSMFIEKKITIEDIVKLVDASEEEVMAIYKGLNKEKD